MTVAVASSRRGAEKAAGLAVDWCREGSLRMVAGKATAIAHPLVAQMVAGSAKELQEGSQLEVRWREGSAGPARTV